VRPDILVAAKGAASGYWPLGFAACSGEVHEKIAGFTHGFTYSHHVVGAAAGHAVLKVLQERELIAASERQGALLRSALHEELGDHPAVGDIRGLGLLCAVEFVQDRSTRTPYPRTARVAEQIVAAGKENGVLLYHSTGCADGVAGDLILLGPPLVITDAQVAELAERTATAVRSVL
jgi:adenosylmethionine-8-amino-7-oxononanoate aminotransferase